MTALWPAYMTVAGLLGVAGVAKLRSPRVAVGAIASGARPVPAAAAARALGAGELALAGACIAAPGRLSALALALAYLALAGVVLRLRAARAAGGCGCFGEDSAPAGLWHFGLDVAAAAVALAAAASPPPAWGVISEHPAQLAIALAGVAAAIALARLAFTALPAAWEAYGSAPTGRSAL
jgi:hypothetical protein